MSDQKIFGIESFITGMYNILPAGQCTLLMGKNKSFWPLGKAKQILVHQKIWVVHPCFKISLQGVYAEAKGGKGGIAKTVVH